MMLAGFVAKLRRNGEKNKFFPVFLERFFLKYNGYLQMAFAMSFSKDTTFFKKMFYLCN